MELPYGFNKGEIEEIINQWDKLYNEVESGTFPIETYDYDQVYEDEEYIDRYVWMGNAEFCISTVKYDEDKRVDIHYLSESLYLNKDGFSEPFLIGELKEMVK